MPALPLATRFGLAGRLSLALFFLAAALYAASLSWENIRSQPLVDAARKLEKSRTAFDAGQLEVLVQSEAMQASLQTCRSDILRPALTVQLVAASSVGPVGDYDAWSRALLRAQAFTRHMIKCLPSEGNAWLREAMLSQAIAENSAELAEKLAIAAALSPYEKIQIRARLALWNRVSDETLLLSADIARMDIRTILHHGDDDLLAPLLLDAVGTFKAYVTEELGTLDAVRRQKIEAAQKRLSEKRLRQSS